ncbi:hypothetical protein L596_020919 [Steinernema carpocapsae]|uniref:Uncharacterized protein n=1 Tax=Steinernema carpocapsae TaxID=34508 RepID=A0A4U5MUX8_STECR|nr:hypothetical protein L596_020919 [Steinernema carpocapsae]
MASGATLKSTKRKKRFENQEHHLQKRQFQKKRGISWTQSSGRRIRNLVYTKLAKTSIITDGNNASLEAPEGPIKSVAPLMLELPLALANALWFMPAAMRASLRAPLVESSIDDDIQCSRLHSTCPSLLQTLAVGIKPCAFIHGAANAAANLCANAIANINGMGRSCQWRMVNGAANAVEQAATVANEGLNAANRISGAAQGNVQDAINGMTNGAVNAARSVGGQAGAVVNGGINAASGNVAPADGTAQAR